MPAATESLASVACKPNPVLRFFPSLTDVAFLTPAIFLFSKLEGAKSLLGDGDTGWHVRTGEWILAYGRVPKTDIFSFTMPGQPWFAWEWLWDVIFGWMHIKAGMAAVVLVSIVILCLTFALLFRLALRRSGNCFLAIATTLLATAGSTIHWLARPHLFTLLFLVVYLALLERVRAEGRVKLLRWLPLLMILWTNLHGGFFIGIIVLATYAAGEFAAALVAPDSESRRA